MTIISNNFADLLSDSEDKECNGIKKAEKLLNVYRHTFKEYSYYHVLDAQFNKIFHSKYPQSIHLDEYYKANRRVLDIFVSVFDKGLEDGSIKIPLSGEKIDSEKQPVCFSMFSTVMWKKSV